jgi:hypothetical protein
MTYTEIWKAKVPLKIKNFTWLVAQKSILAKENIILGWRPRLFLLW